MAKEPAILYHYCPLESFEKIIKTKTLRFGDITKSTDSEELFFIYKLYHLFCGKGSNDFNSNLYFAQEDNEYNKTYCFCLSELEDDLSQWRGFAPNGGIAIGFDVQKLKELACNIQPNKIQPHGELTKVTYLSENPKSRNYYEKSLSFTFGKIRGESSGSPAPLQASKLSEIACKYKSDSFKSEKEWRMSFKCFYGLSQEAGIKVHDIDLSMADDAFYVPFHFSMISKIIIGPKNAFLGQSKQLPQLVYSFLKANDNETCEDGELNLSISEQDLILTKLSYR